MGGKKLKKKITYCFFLCSTILVLGALRVQATETATNEAPILAAESLKLLDNYSELSVLKDWMKTNSSPGVSPGRGIPGLWTNAFASDPKEGKLYLPQAKDANMTKMMSVNNSISPAFTNGDDEHMLLLPPGSNDPKVVVEKADEYALYTSGGGLTNNVTANNEDNTAKLELIADASGVTFKVTRLVEDTQPTETATLNTKFTFKDVKSVINATVAEYLNGNTGGGRYSEFSGYYYTTADVTVDLSKYLATDRTTLKIKEENPTIHVGDTWDASQYFISATDQDGKQLAYKDIKVSGDVDTSKSGTYDVTYSYGGLTQTRTVTVEPALSLTVPESVGFGSVRLGANMAPLTWEKGQDIVVTSSLKNGWSLTAKIQKETKDFSNYIYNGNQLLNQNATIATSTAIGETTVNQEWNTKTGIYIDYSKANELRKDSAEIEWTLSPNANEVKE